MFLVFDRDQATVYLLLAGALGPNQVLAGKLCGHGGGVLVALLLHGVGGTQGHHQLLM